MQTNSSNKTTPQLGCPRRGLLDDPETRLTFPSPAVVCYEPTQPTSISVEHQIEFCLCANYVNCPVYQHKVVTPPPPKEAAGAALLARPLWLAIPLLLIGILVAAGISLNNSRQVASVPPPIAIDTVEVMRVDVDDQGPDIFAEVTAVETLASVEETLTPTPEGFVLLVLPEDEPLPTETATQNPTSTPRATSTLRATSTSRATSTNTPTPEPTNTLRPIPTNTARPIIIRPRATITPNYAATQETINRINRARATQSAAGTRAAITARQTAVAEPTIAVRRTVAAQQTITARQTVVARQTANAQQASAAAAAQAATTASIRATQSAQATSDFWNAALTQTAQAVPTIQATATPLPDRDLDRIPDAEDACPDQYGIPEFGGCNPFEGSSGDSGSGGDGRDDGGSDGGDGRD